MVHHRNYATAFEMHHFKQNFANDLRYGAPASDVQVYKMINGEKVLVDIQPDITYEKALEITNEIRHRNNGAKGEQK